MKKRIKFWNSSVFTCLVLVLSVFLYIKNNDSKKLLTMNELYILADKGVELTWSDFDTYNYTDIGSGVYYRVYEINNGSKLIISGNDLTIKPQNIIFQNENGEIDIRYNSLQEFLNQ